MITVKPPMIKLKKDIFEPKSLVMSTAGNGNIYLVIGPGDTPEHFTGVRLAGRGTYACQSDLIRDLVVAYDGEVVIKNA